MKVLANPTVVAVLALGGPCTLGLSGCQSSSYSVYEPRDRRPLRADITAELNELAAALEERATLRVPLGSARVRVTDLEPVLSRESRHRFAVLEERDVEATQTTIRRELEIALADRMNIIDPDVVRADDEPVAATHEVDGTFVRTGEDIEITLRLVDLRDGWIVATAGRRIFGFVPRDYIEPSRTRAERPELVAGVEETAPVPAERVEPIGPAIPGGSSGGEGPLDEVDSAGYPEGAAIPADAVIEFEAGPAASRLEALQNAAKPDDEPDRMQD